METHVAMSRPAFYLRARLAGAVCAAFTPRTGPPGPQVQVAVLESDNNPAEALGVARLYADIHEATEAASRLGPLFWLTQDASILAHPRSALEVVEIKQDRAVVCHTLPPSLPNRAPTQAPLPAQSMMGQPHTRAEFEALVQYRGPAVVARKDLFGQVNQALAARFEPMLGASSPNASAAMRQDLRALADRIRNPFFRDQAHDALDPLYAFAEHGESLTCPAVTSVLMGLRLWLNLAVLEDSLDDLQDHLTPPIYANDNDDAPND